MREEGCSLPQSMGPLLSGPMVQRGARNRTLAQFSATVSGGRDMAQVILDVVVEVDKRGQMTIKRRKKETCECGCVWVVVCSSLKVKQHCSA